MKYLELFTTFESKIYSMNNIFNLIKRHDIDGIKDYLSNHELDNEYENENTPLMYAILRSDDDIVSLLIVKTKNINYQDYYTENALSMLINTKPSKRLKILKILLTRKDLDINCEYEYGQNILMRYFYELKTPSVPNFGDEEDGLILGLPKEYTRFEKMNNDSLYDMIILLIKSGADITHLSNDNKTFMEIIASDKYLINRIKDECPVEYSRYERKMKSKKFNL